MTESIESWLQRLGLEKYAAQFADQEIDQSILPDLTEADLEKLGIPLGPRKKILKAIVERDTAPAVLITQTAEDTAPYPTPRSHQVERRQLTVMFCDLVGSTALSQKLDPEDMSDVLRAFQDACHAAIERYDGFIARYMGDGVMVYFGYPQAHEDEAERAIHSGLALIESMNQVNANVGEKYAIELTVRVGIATGLVVVGDLIGEGAAQESAAVGETPNLAARLQAIAEPNTLVVSPATHNLAASQFEYTDLGTHQLKGIADSVRAWRVLAPAATESRFDALHGTHLTPLVGREHEIGLLFERWKQARDGEGQVMLLSGEPGIGKSRITQTLSDRIAQDHPIRLRYQCSPYYTNSTLHPVIQQLERVAQFEDDDSAVAKLNKLKSVLLQSMREVETVISLFASLLSIPGPDQYSPSDLTPERQKEALLEALTAQLYGLSQKRTVLVLFEDVHWADPTSLELLELAVERVHNMRVLMVITFRPEFIPPWQGRTHIMSLTLSRFSRESVMAMVGNVTGGKSLPANIRDQIVEKTDGVPLFVEELTKTILESGLLKEQPDSYELSGIFETVAIPATLYDSLMMRLDRLNAVKEVAQLASVIGREFSYDLLATVSSLDDRGLDDALDKLVSVELVHRRGGGRRSSYIFKHALVQDAAYESLLKNKRQSIHEHIAQSLAEEFPGIAERQPELLAHHYTMASRGDEAIKYWHLAGQRATQRSSYVEASNHLSKGLQLLKTLSETPEHARQELSMQTALATVLLPTKGYGSTEVAQAYARAKELCEQLGDTENLFPVLFGQWASGVHRHNLEEILQLSEEIHALVQDSTDFSAVLMGNRTLGNSLLFTGRLNRARHHLQWAADSYEMGRHAELAFRYGLDIRSASLTHLLITNWILGFPDRAAEAGEHAIAHAETTQHGNSIAHTLVHAGTFFEQFCNNPTEVRKHARRLATICEEGSFRMFLAWCNVLEGWAIFELGEQSKGLSLMETGIRDAQTSGSDMYQPYFLTLLAQSHAKLNQYSQGLSAIDEAIQFVEKRDERWYAAEVYRVKGTFILRGEENEIGAEQLFEQAREIAQQQEAKSLELRSVTSLAQLWNARGKRDEARHIMNSVYDWFTEGFDTADLENAKVLIQSLG